MPDEAAPLPPTPAPAAVPPPGTVIDHLAASTRRYVGSPSLVVVRPGVYVACHDEFGPGSSAHQAAVTQVFRSEDRGATWRHLVQVQPAFWSSLFIHGGALYLLGTTHEHGLLVIRRSTDGGVTWTIPAKAATGLLTETGQYHTAPTPTVVHHDRVWRAVEDAGGGTKWGERYRPMMLSAPANADLLDRKNWTFSAFLEHDRAWLDGRFNAWLEGNAVPDPDGGMIDLLRVDYPPGNRAAVVKVSEDGTRLAFDPVTGFVDFPGAATKFQVRQDPRGSGYWALSNASVPPVDPKASAGSLRNTLTLLYSEDLHRWEIRSVPLHHPDASHHGFQYPDWQFDGDDLIAVVRTAFEDDSDGAHNYHDANFLTFHRFQNFRALRPMPMMEELGLRRS